MSRAALARLAALACLGLATACATPPAETTPRAGVGASNISVTNRVPLPAEATATASETQTAALVPRPAPRPDASANSANTGTVWAHNRPNTAPAAFRDVAVIRKASGRVNIPLYNDNPRLLFVSGKLARMLSQPRSDIEMRRALERAAVYGFQMGGACSPVEVALDMRFEALKNSEETERDEVWQSGARVAGCGRIEDIALLVKVAEEAPIEARAIIDSRRPVALPASDGAREIKPMTLPGSAPAGDTPTTAQDTKY